jgi:hypothetical protein
MATPLQKYSAERIIVSVKTGVLSVVKARGRKGSTAQGCNGVRNVVRVTEDVSFNGHLRCARHLAAPMDLQ